MTSSKQKYAKFRKAGAKPLNDPRHPDAPKLPKDKKKRRRYFRDYIGWLWPFRFSILRILIIATATASLSLILPRATMYIVDDVLTRPDRGAAFRLLHLIGIGLLVVITVQQGLDWLRHWSIAVLNARVLTRLRQRLYDHMLRLPLHELSELKTGGITSRLSGDVDSVTGVVQIAIITPTIATLKVILTLIMLLWINWKMCIAAACLLPGIVVLNLLYIKRIRPIYRSMRQDRSDIDSRVVESFGGIRVVRAFAREFNEAKNYGILHHTVIRKQLLARSREFVVWSGWGYLIPVCALVIIWFGGTLVLKDQATVGGIVAFQMYVMMLLSPMSSLVESFGQTQQALAAMERIFDVLNVAPDMPDRDKALAAPSGVASIEFDRVSFRYPKEAKLAEHNTMRQAQTESRNNAIPGGMSANDNPFVLRDVTLRVPGGSTVALVGPSGSGKTTITNLVARFFDPTEGIVRLNGIDLRDIQLRSYRRMLGLVQQDTFLFDGTIAENIAYKHPESTRDAIIEAAKRANAHQFISAFPDGYDTLIGERGVRLSGGQAQRVSIARAILADPRILILDEATSNLDSESEQLIQAALAELMQDRTTFVIAHRLSTITHADMIVVIEDGRITETGTHAELMAADSRYREMVERQQRATLGESTVAEWL
ncbi:MAG: ABC transporter ATP-binding protein [Phycisphaerae bacterium]